MFKYLCVSLAVTSLLLGCNTTTSDKVELEQGQAAADQQDDRAGHGSTEQLPETESTGDDLLEARLAKIGRAFHAFHEEFGHFPPAASRDTEGAPLLSWRVHLLPFLGYDDLYSQFHLNEAWDSPHNNELVGAMPEEYLTGEAGQSKTSMVVFLGEVCVFGGQKAESWSRPLRPYVKDKTPEPQKEMETSIAEEEQATVLQQAHKYAGPRIVDILDGTSNTIFVVQAGNDKQVFWSKPEDVAFQPKDPIAALGDVPETGFLALYGDGKVKLISSKVTPEKLGADITRAGRDYDLP